MAPKSRTADAKIAEIASSAHGVVTRGELLAARLSIDEIRHRLASGALIPQHRGVYRVGHQAPSTEAGYLSAVKACGDGAVLSGRAAAYLWGLIKGVPPPPEIITPTERRVTGVKTMRSRNLDARETTTRRGIRITTVPATLVALSAELAPSDLARACHEAGVKYRTTPRQVQRVLARRGRAPGAAKLRRIMSGDERVTLSTLERRFLQRLKAAGLPLPITNKPAGTKRVDCRWPEHHLTVELDSYRYHGSRYAWEQSYRREREARARGDEFRRYTWHDVADDPGPMLKELGGLLPTLG